jgi:proteic killer suppression protein
MIRTWRNRHLKELFETGFSRRIDQKLQNRCLERLRALNAATDLRQLNVTGYELHRWKGANRPWSISVSGPWRILFDWQDGDAYNVDLAQPHG